MSPAIAEVTREQDTALQRLAELFDQIAVFSRPPVGLGPGAVLAVCYDQPAPCGEHVDRGIAEGCAACSWGARRAFAVTDAGEVRGI